MKSVLLALTVLSSVLAAECPATALNPQEEQSQFQALDRKAQVEFRHGEFTQAAEDFRRAACMVPGRFRAYYELYGSAVQAVSAGDSAAAWQALEQADRLRPDYPLPLAMLVKISLVFGDVERAKTALLEAAQRFPRDAKLHAELAQDLLNQKQYDLALAEALRFEQSGLRDAKVTVNLAVLENQAGALSDAIRHATAIEEQHELPEKLRASGAAIAGFSYESLGQFPEAAQHLKLAIRFAPDQENSYLALSRIYEKEQNYNAAVEILEQARKQLPGSPQILLALGSDLIAAEQHRAASQVLTGLIENFPDQLEAYPKLAEAYRNMGEPGLSTQTLRKLAGRKPDYPMLHVVIAQSMLDEESVDYEGVLKELAQAEKTSPTDPDIYYLRGKVYFALRRYEQAIGALRHAIELRPTESGAHYLLGLAYRKAGRAALAKQQFETVEYLKSQSIALKARD